MLFALLLDFSCSCYFCCSIDLMLLLLLRKHNTLHITVSESTIIEVQHVTAQIEEARKHYAAEHTRTHYHHTIFSRG